MCPWVRWAGTPNLSREVRAIPHPGTFWAPWFRGGEIERQLPHRVWQALSPRGQHICRCVVGLCVGGYIIRAPAAAAGTVSCPSFLVGSLFEEIDRRMMAGRWQPQGRRSRSTGHQIGSRGREEVAPMPFTQVSR
jgi:hypothetical protein